ncbi:hypothetical protein [Pseudonocardia sp. T1-2H]|uniref:hypothetical protein n=1 Tax=Pseudonocardia sp. T1-2H TaxID=3128899 RepID=UPI00310188FF
MPSKILPADAKLPPVIDGRYRLYTADVLPFGAVPEHPEGPARVSHTRWLVSFDIVDGGPETTLNARIISMRSQAGGTVIERHELDRTVYPSSAAASRAAYEAGLTAYMVHISKAARWGLPAGITGEG